MISEAMNGWKKSKVTGSKSRQLFAKAKAAKSKLKERVAAGKRVISASKELEVKLAEVDAKASINGWSQGLREERAILINNL